ncbi:MAG: DsbA family protein [Tepidisphaeraceae bacterium]
MSQDELADEVDLLDPVTSTDHLIGNPDARITLLEYGDYECPDCFNAVPVIAALRGRLGDALRVAFRHFPQNSVHPRASAAAAAAEAAGNQQRFWEMHEVLFRHQKELADLDLSHLALRVGLEIYRFQRDVETEAVIRRIQSDHASGGRSGVTGTPTFFVNGWRYRGKVEIQAMVEAVKAGRMK